MKNTIQIQAMIMLAFFLSLPFLAVTQEDAGKKKVRIKTVREIDGKETVTDTTFYVSDDEDVTKVIEEMNPESEGDTSATVKMEVMVDVESDAEWDASTGKKVIVMKKGGGTGSAHPMQKKKVIIIDEEGNEKVMVFPQGRHKQAMKFKSDADDEIVIIRPHGLDNPHYVYKWKGEDGEEYTFDYDFDMDIDMENFQEDMAKLQEELKEMHIRIMDEEGNIMEKKLEMEVLAELKELEQLEALEELENMEIMVVPPHPPYAPRMDAGVNRHTRGGMEVSGIELREAGIKNKPDRLELDEIDIEKDNGVVDLTFSMKAEGSPKVIVYNIYGDKVYNGKPELMDTKYQMKIDLSKKQHGIYYLMIISGNSSKTLRLHI